jgi:hypothetical protein
MMKYLVEIIPESITDLPGTTSKLAQTLKLDPAKAAALLKRNPVTKPVSQAEAEKVARLFTKAGIEVFIRSEEEVAAPTEVSSPPEASQPSVSIVSNSALLEQTHIDDAPVNPQTTPVPETHSSTPDLTVKFEEANQAHVADITTPHVDTSHTSSARPPSVVPEIGHVSSVRSEAETESAHKQNTLNINTMHGEETLKIPQGFFTPVPESETESVEPSEATEATVVPTPTRSPGLGKIAFVSIVPGLLALAGVLTALYLLGLPLLRSQQRVAAETTAISLANSIGGWIGDVSLTNPTLSQQIQSVITRTQAELRTRNIDFVLLSDTEGNQLAGWFKDLPTPGVPDTVTATEEVRSQISYALGAAVASQTGTPVGENAPSASLIVDGETLELAAAGVRQGTTPVGAVVVGSSQQNLTARLRDPLTMIVLAGVVPLLIGIALSFLIGRNRS